MNLEHDRCSELLGPLLRGELSEREATSVEDHIAGCEDCRAERKGLEALIGARAPIEPLSDLERARLHRAITEAMPAGAHSARTIVPEPAKPWTARIAPYLGAAAALVLVVFGATQIDLGGSDEGGAATGGAALRESDASGGGGDGGGSANDTVSGEAAVADSAPAPGPSFQPDAGTIERESLRRFGARNEPFTTFARSYETKDAAQLTEPYLDDLAAAGAETGDPDTIVQCGRQVLDSQDGPTLPAYAGYGEMEERDVLMMGFVYSAADSGPLDKFMLWVWPRDDCSIPSEYQFGTIKP
jgi:hypothetical protein